MELNSHLKDVIGIKSTEKNNSELQNNTTKTNNFFYKKKKKITQIIYNYFF